MLFSSAASRAWVKVEVGCRPRQLRPPPRLAPLCARCPLWLKVRLFLSRLEIRLFRWQLGLDQVDRDVDVAPCRVRIRAQLVRCVDQILSNFGLQTWQADVEAGCERVSAASCAQVHFSVNRHISWESDLPFAGRELYRTEETGRPTGGEKLLRVGAGARGARRRQLNLKSPIVGARGSAFSTTRGVSFGSVQYFFEFCHGRYLYLSELSLRFSSLKNCPLPVFDFTEANRIETRGESEDNWLMRRNGYMRSCHATKS
jgi:hypothetical protein